MRIAKWTDSLTPIVFMVLVLLVALSLVAKAWSDIRLGNAAQREWTRQSDALERIADALEVGTMTKQAPEGLVWDGVPP